MDAPDLSEFEKRLDRADLYSQKPHALAPQVDFEAGTDALSWRDSKGRTGALPYGEIARVRLGYDPGRMQAPAYTVEIEGLSGARVKVTSTTYRGMGSYRSRGRVYARFVEELHRRIATVNSGVEWRVGRGGAGFIAYATVWFIGLVAIAYGVWLAFVAGQNAIGLMLGMMTAYFGYLGVLYVRNNWPRAYDPHAMPRDLLPTPTDQDG